MLPVGRSDADPDAMCNRTWAGQRLDLDRLKARGRLRRLSPRTGIDFSSNDYLGLAGSPRMAKAVASAIEAGVPIGAGGSRLLRGNAPEHEALEHRAAAFFGAQAALFFGSGFAANTALFTTLPQSGDLIAHDSLIHASVHEGARGSRADVAGFAHNDPQAASDLIASWRHNGGGGTPWISIESLYSMDGDFAPVGDFMAVADRFDAMLVIDDAHSVGVWGPDGRGHGQQWQDRENVITLKTCGKALGAEGALLCGPRIMRDFLIARARSFIFSTAPSPLMAVAVGEALSIVAEEPERREALMERIELARAHFAPFGVSPSASQIMPVILGDDARTMRTAEQLQQTGFDIRGIRPPTVPSGTSRLRISLTLNLTGADIASLAQHLMEIF